MKVAVLGGHGKVARLLLKLLAESGHSGIGLIRNSEHAGELRKVGAEPVLCDLEADDDVAAAVSGADVVVFAAGAGPGSGAERKRRMDLGGALKLIDAAKVQGIDRYLMISSMGATNPPPKGGGTFGEFLRAKGEADRALVGSGLRYTIVRPGRLTDDPPTGRVRIAPRLERGSISRGDVAGVLLVALLTQNTVGREFDLLAGETPIEEALSARDQR